MIEDPLLTTGAFRKGQERSSDPTGSRIGP